MSVRFRRSTTLVVMCVALIAATVPTRAEESGQSAEPSTSKLGWLGRIGRFRLPDEHERNHLAVRAAFRDVTRPASRYTVRVLGNGVQVALGTIVRSDGYVISKASELSDDPQCALGDGRRMKAQLVAVDEASDVALLKLDALDLPAVEWSEAETVPIGSWLATPSWEETPTAIGVVSAPMREIPKPRAVLGVVLDDSQKGPRIGRILPRSPAAKAGLESGDVVVGLDGKELSSRVELIEALSHRQPGDRVVLSVVRDTRSLSVTATLEDMSRVGNEEQAELMDNLGGPLSKRRYGFPAVLQHDSVLRPKDCGGPVVDLDGKVVGINIARASRVASYALPASRVKPLVANLLADHLTQVARERPADEAAADR